MKNNPYNGAIFMAVGLIVVLYFFGGDCWHHCH